MECLRSLLKAVPALLVLLPAAAALCADPPVETRREAAQDRPAGAETPAAVPLARYITLASPVDDVVFGHVQNAALTLQSQARSQHRRAILILEITPGSSPFHQVQGLATFLTSVDIADVKTIAWVPETVTGNNVILALACNEIVMHPDAELGDIGRGKPLDRDEQHDVERLVEKRHNPLISTALVRGMMDADSATLRVKVQITAAGKESTEFRILTKDELDRLRQTKTAILDVRTIKEAGDVGKYSGSKARSLDLLAVQTAESRGEIAQLYNLPREALRDDVTSGDKPRAEMIKVDGKIEPVLEAFIERQIERSVGSGVNTIIFHIESDGGPLAQSNNLASAIADLDPKKVRTIAYIPKEALGSAVVVALGCDEIYLQPTARFGDVRPTEGDADRPGDRISEDVMRHYKDALTALAKRKNRPEGIAAAMADKNAQVFQVKNRRTGKVWYLTDEEIHESNGEWEKGLPLPESGRNHLMVLSGVRAPRVDAGRASGPRLRRSQTEIGRSPRGERRRGEKNLGRQPGLLAEHRFGAVFPGRRRLHLHLHRAAFDDGRPFDRGRVVLCPLLLEPLSRRDRRLARGFAVSDRCHLPGARDLCLARLRSLRRHGRAPDFCVADSGQPDLEQYRTQRELPAALVDAGNVGRVPHLGDCDCRFDQPISTPCSRLRPLDAVSARRNWRCDAGSAFAARFGG